MGCCVNNLHGICASYWDHKETDSSADLELYIKHSRVGENKGIQATSNTLNRKWRVSAIAARCFFFPLSGSHTHTHWGQRWRKAHAAGSSTGVSYSGINFHFIEHGFIRIKKILPYGTSSVFTSNTYSSASTWVSRTQQYPDGLSWPPSLWIHREERKKENVSVVYFFKLNIVFMMLDVDGTPPELPSSS